MDNAPAPIDPATAYRAMLARDVRFDGRFFTCVRTTGIYCRPVCPARPPKFENCRFVASAAAAQAAGFRPCLRCRPETAPDMGAWNGSSNTVRRALALIEAGALDSGDVEALGDRLGVGGRQLRRLFRQHLGASPVAVAQTARVLLAKQLIHDTGLSMAEVAFAAGFGSVRRFNETFQALYQRPPGALRRRKTDAGGPLRLHLRYRGPLDWDDLLTQIAAQGDAAETVADGRYQRRFDGGGVSVGRVDAERLTAEIDLPKLDALPRLIAALRRRLDLAADPAAIAAVLAADPRLAAAVAARPGLRVPGAWDAPADPTPDPAENPAWRPWGVYAARYLALNSGASDAIAA
jgi:AraC family transcriptional regulator of adaptative response / DNA-3-methyladenine glycosylase II